MADKRDIPIILPRKVVDKKFLKARPDNDSAVADGNQLTSEKRV
jgi:hypothetical protein